MTPEEEEDEWVTSTTPGVQPTGRTAEQRAAGDKQDSGGYGFKKHFQFKFEEETHLKRVESSILPHGYATGTLIGLIGPPGTGKTRYALQEVIMAAIREQSSLYIFNETVDTKFKATIRRIAEALGITNNRQLQKVYFWETVKQQLSAADYDTMERIAGRIWVKNVEFWLDNECDGDPTFVVFDSFSNISRRFVPQTPIFHQYLVHQLAELYEKKGIEPITLMIYQKSLSPREINTDAVVGGYGVNHEVDMEVVLKLKDVDKWDSMRYGWREGTTVHTLQITKDRYPEEEFEESLITLEKGKLTLGTKISTLVENTATAKVAARQEEREGVGEEVNW